MNGVLTVGEVAAKLRVSDESVYRLVRTGQLRSVRIGGLWRIPQEALDSFLAEAGSELQEGEQGGVVK